MPVSNMWPIRPLVKGNNRFPVGLIYVSVNSNPDRPPWATPGDSYILVASVVEFSLLCLALGSARGGGGLKSKSKFDNFEKSATFALPLKQGALSSL